MKIFCNNGLKMIVSAGLLAGGVVLNPAPAAAQLSPSGDNASGSNPKSLAEDVSIEKVRSVPFNVVRICYDAGSNSLFYLTRSGDIFRLDLAANEVQLVATSADHATPEPRGMVVSSDGTMYLLGNQRAGQTTSGIVRRATLANGDPLGWETVATSEAYPLANGPFDHLMNGLAVSPDGSSLFVSAGSRTDHGEVEDNGGSFPDLREVPISSLLLRLPADATNLVVPNDAALLESQGYAFADGFRNTFDLEWGPNGHLFGTENSGDRDDPDELNWIRPGRHYGFPWSMGGNRTPQQDPDFDPTEDPLIGPGALPVFSNDPGYPAPPSNVQFEEPLANSGPDADSFRDPATGDLLDASDDGMEVRTFTPHRSPLGLVFDTAGVLAEPYEGDGFVLSWTGEDSPLLSPLADPGQDLLHLDLSWNEVDSSYALSSTRIAEGFNRPVDAVLVGSALYVLEMGFSEAEDPSLWKVGLPSRPIGEAVIPDAATPAAFGLDLYPNPVTTSGRLRLSISDPGRVSVSFFDVAGGLARSATEAYLLSGTHEIPFSLRGLPGGLYFARVRVGAAVKFVKVVWVD